MAVIQDLLKRVADAELRARLEEEIGRLTKHKKFGLVFEEHLPECTPLYDVKIKRGMTVATKQADCGALFVVKSIKDGVAEVRRLTPISSEATLTLRKERNVSGASDESEFFKTDELVAVARFGDPIYPCLKKLDAIDNGGGDLWHTLIQADNYHALQLLEYLYPGKVDCIYIDPPYNTGAKDWKYNNDYVDSSDSWRHSKWLSMMEKRLALAKKLLNPKDSVLIVTIDEKEYLHLGMLLEQMFPEARIQMVSSVINNGGTVRSMDFARTDEYLYFVKFGCAAPVALPLDDDWMGKVENTTRTKLRWRELIRHGAEGVRSARPNLFYPIYVSVDGKRFMGVGSSLALDQDRNSVRHPENVIPIWPIHGDGTEGRWGYSSEQVLELQKNGYLRLGKLTERGMTISFLQPGQQKRLAESGAVINGRREDGSLDIESEEINAKYVPGTQWSIPSHNASSQGSVLLQSIIGKRFSFPKSLYAVHDAIRFFVAEKPNSIILDFFAGSGTTLHAVNLLNAEDGGNRRCILVTNNEVSADEQKDFTKRGIKPGDEEWEQKGIAQYVTWPRTTCSIKGVDVKGVPLKGEYLGGTRSVASAGNDGADADVTQGSGRAEARPSLKMSDGFKANAAFFKLGFVDPSAVSIGRAFKEILPLLWLKAGAHGACPTADARDARPSLVLPENRFAVLMDECYFASFAKEVNQHPEIETLYFVTDYERSYKAMAARFPGKTPYQLYTDYLENFRVNRSEKFKN